MILSLFLLGGFYEFTSCIIFLLISIFVIVDNHKNQKTYRLGINALCIIAISLAYLLSIVFAVDRGMAFIGFVKYMPLIPLVLVISQMNIEDRKNIIRWIPELAVIMTLVSGVLSLSESFSSFLNVNDNLAGLFQYPNTFALFLTIGLIVLVDRRMEIQINEETEDKIEWTTKPWMIGAYAIIMLSGIIASGSRTAMLILIVYCLLLLYRRNTRKVMTYVLVGIAATAMLGIIVISILGKWDSVASVLDLGMSTFYGRLLYWQDAIIPIVTHPLGLGAWGYLFTQGSFQTGVYAVTYVHNDFLQLFLDAGWIAGIAFIVAIVRTIKSKKIPQLFKTILVFMCFFMMMDFHLQYLSMFIILLLCMDYSVGKKKVVIHTTKLLQGVLVIGLLISIYFGVALSLKYLGLDEQYAKMYPYDTEIMLEELGNATTVEESNAIAERILEYNTSISAVYGAKAEYAYSEYDFQAVSEYKLMEISLSPYTSGNYRELIDMMNVGMLMYEEVEDTVSALYCKGIILQVPDMLEELNENTSYLGTMIDASPYRALSDEYIEYLEGLE